MEANPDTLGAAMDAAWERFADSPALSFNGITSTYGTLDAAATRLASAYRALGVSQGDRILCQLPNRPEFLIAAVAAWRQGAIHVGADKDLTSAEVGQLVEYLSPAVLLTYGREDRDTARLVEAVRDVHPGMHVVVVCGGDLQTHGCYSWSDLMKPGTTYDRQTMVKPRPEDPAVILLTSGTTGQPKGIVRYHGQLLGHWTRTATLLRGSPGDRHLVQLPLSYGFGFGLAVAGLLTGGLLVPVERFSPEETLQIIGNDGITVLNGTPAHFRLLLNRLRRARHDTSSLRIGAGSAARFPPALLQGIFEDLRMDFIHTYGCSEGLGWKTIDKGEMLRGSVGRPPSDRVRVVGPDGNPLPPGEIGEVIVRKTHPVRYWRENVPDADTDPDWHYMGDRGVTDEAGHLYVLSPVNHQINRGGLKVDPGEVEAALWAHPRLLDAAVAAVPDAVHGQIICACVVPEHGARPTLMEVRSFLAGSLARHKLPERLCVLERVPRSRVGKVDRAELQLVAVGASGEPGRAGLDQEAGRADSS